MAFTGMFVQDSRPFTYPRTARLARRLTSGCALAASASALAAVLVPPARPLVTVVCLLSAGAFAAVLRPLGRVVVSGTLSRSGLRGLTAGRRHVAVRWETIASAHAGAHRVRLELAGGRHVELWSPAGIDETMVEVLAQARAHGATVDAPPCLEPAITEIAA